MLKQRIPEKKLVETPTPKSFKSTQINVRAKALEATVSESGRQLQTPKVSVEFPLLAVYDTDCHKADTTYRQEVSFKHSNEKKTHLGISTYNFLRFSASCQEKNTFFNHFFIM